MEFVFNFYYDNKTLHMEIFLAIGKKKIIFAVFVTSLHGYTYIMKKR